MQAWLEEIKWQQTIDEEKEIAREEGYAEGERRGAQQNAIANAKNFLAMNNLSSEQIANGTGLPLEQVLALKKELSQTSN